MKFAEGQITPHSPSAPSGFNVSAAFAFTEDEQRTNMASQKSLQQLTVEKEQALSDLNSVERSLSDLFRRYENLKGVLEGFKKVLYQINSFSSILACLIFNSPDLP